KALLEKEYNDLMVTEILLEAMERDNVSVRKLSKMAGVSPTIIQGIRSGEKKNLNINTLNRILGAIGYEIAFVPKQKRS
ncbi:MAG: helix-turn-helix domain-containing protein, partial [Chlamydiia bacterium]|nr:helix-turn-helix domain-containing protein [Chlamydiia bacterium]